MEEIQGLIDAHNQFKATLGEADKEYNSIVSLVKEVETTVQKYQIPGGLANPYTTLTASVSTRIVIAIQQHPRLSYSCSSRSGHDEEMDRSETFSAPARFHVAGGIEKTTKYVSFDSNTDGDDCVNCK